MTKEQKERTIAALLEEKRGYENRVLLAQEEQDEEATELWQKHVADVESELKKLGQSASKASARAEKRPAGNAAATR